MLIPEAEPLYFFSYKRRSGRRQSLMRFPSYRLAIAAARATFNRVGIMPQIYYGTGSHSEPVFHLHGQPFYGDTLHDGELYGGGTYA